VNIIHCCIKINIIIIKSRAIGHIQWNIKENIDDRCTTNECMNREKKNHLFRFSDTTSRERGELFFFLFSRLSTLNIPFSFSFSLYCPIVNYYTKWIEHKANLILCLGSSFLLLILTCNDLDYWKSNYSKLLVNVDRYYTYLIHQHYFQMPLVRIHFIWNIEKVRRNKMN
jgi:hypothetical protein